MSYDESYVEGLLDEAKTQLKKVKPTAAITELIKAMTQMIPEEERPVPEKKAPPKKPKATPKAAVEKDVDMRVVSECSVCGQERRSDFFKRGFKCDACRGVSHEVLPPTQSHSPSVVPCTMLPPGYYFVPMEALAAASQAAAEGHEFELHIPPAVKYSVLAVNGDFSEAYIRQVRAKVAHPCIACIFAITRGKDKRSALIVHENAVPVLDSMKPYDDLEEGDFQGVKSCATFDPDSAAEIGKDEIAYERVKKITLSLLYSVKALHDQGFTHNDLRPHNVLVDQYSNIKLRFGMFEPNPLPEPFRDPEEDGKNLRQSDLYCMGVSLSIIAFGAALRYPPEPSVEDLHLIELIKSFTAPRASRATLEKVLSSPYLSSMRTVNGVPVETQVAHISGSTKSGEPALILNSSQNPGAEAKELHDFVEQHGPVFQVIKSAGHVSLYSLKSDPRRRRAKTMIV